MKVFTCLLLLLSALSLVGQGESSKAARVLPTASELRGWREVPGSYQYGAGDGLTGIYDGGYMLYVNAGVVEAAQKLYSKEKLYLTITAHTMQTASKATAFLKHWENTYSKQRRERTPGRGSGFLVVTGGATNVYWVNGGYFVTIMVTGTDTTARREALAALAVVSRKVPTSR